MRKLAVFGAVVLTASLFDMQSTMAQSELDSLDQRAAEIEQETEDKGECVASATFDAEWGLTSMSFDVPEVTFKMREMKFHFVKTDFNMKTISFDVPKVEWGTTEVLGAKLDLPKFYRQRVEIKTKIPEFTWDLTSIKTKIPEFSRKRVEWKFHILKIGKLQEASIPCKDKATSTAAAAGEIEQLSAEYQQVAADAAVKQTATAANEIAASVASWEHDIQGALAQLDQTISEIQANGGDPSSVMGEFDGKEVSLIEMRSLIASRFQEEIAAAVADHALVVKELEAIAEGKTK